MNATTMIQLDGSECPVCLGWNCTKAAPHEAWIFGTPQNIMARSKLGENARTLARLLTEARTQVAKYPQYNDAYFTGWTLGRLTRRVDTKLGVAGEKGDLVMFKRGFLGSDTFWSLRNGCATTASYSIEAVK